MRRTVKHLFQTNEFLIDTSGQIHTPCRYNLNYGSSEKIIFPQGTMYVQYFSHFLFFIEITCAELISDLHTGYINEKKNIFFFMMLEGSMAFYKNDGSFIARAEKNNCYTAMNRKGEFRYYLPKGKHEFIFITPRRSWLNRGIASYPRIGQILMSMKNTQNTHSELFPCKADTKLEILINELLNLKKTNLIAFESKLFNCVRSIINHYQIILDIKLSQRVYLIREYINENYFDSTLTNKKLSAYFCSTEKTIIKTFKLEFGITPYRYLINTRLEKAKSLISIKKIRPSQVYLNVGYSDFQSFRKQFKNYFGISPSKFL